MSLSPLSPFCLSRGENLNRNFSVKFLQPLYCQPCLELELNRVPLLSPSPQPPSCCKMVWIFKIITHRLLSVLKKGGVFFKKRLAVPPTGWKLGLETCRERRGVGRVWGKRRDRLGDSECGWGGSQGERAGDPATSPRGVKLLKKKKKKPWCCHCQ